MAKGYKKRGDVFYSNLIIPRSGGKRHVEALGKDEGEARRLVKKLAVILEEQNPRDSAAQTGRDMSIVVFMQKVLAHYRTGAKNTYRTVARAMENLLKFAPIKTAGQITPDLLRELRKHYIETGRIAGDINGNPVGKKNVPMVNREIRQLVTIMRWAEDEDTIKMPMQNWRPVSKTQMKEMKTRKLTYTPDEHKRLQEAAHGLWRETATYMLARHAGLRLSELRHLRRRDIDLSTLAIHVRAKTWADPRTGETREWFPKGSKGQRERDRVVPIEKDGPLLPYLKERLLQMPGDWVLSEDQDPPCHENRISGYWHKIVKASGVGVGSVHTLRHCFATDLVARGEPMSNVQAFLGHSSILTTTMVYNHFVPVKFATSRKEPHEQQHQ